MQSYKYLNLIWKTCGINIKRNPFSYENSMIKISTYNFIEGVENNIYVIGHIYREKLKSDELEDKWKCRNDKPLYLKTRAALN